MIFKKKEKPVDGTVVGIAEPAWVNSLYRLRSHINHPQHFVTYLFAFAILGALISASTYAARAPVYIRDAPKLLSPANNEKIYNIPSFNWEKVNGAVAYQLQYTDAGDEEYLNSTSVAIRSRSTKYNPEIFDKGEFIWRVRGVSRKVNFGPWSTSSRFTHATQGSAVVPSPEPVTLKSRIEAEAYRVGGEAVGYHDSTPGNLGNGTCRNDDVDMKSTGSNCSVGWFVNGEWMQYRIKVSKAGKYTFKAHVAKGDTSESRFTLLFNGQEKTQVTVENTGGWSSFQTVTSSFELPEKSIATFKVKNVAGLHDIDWYEFIGPGSVTIVPEQSSSNVPQPATSSVPYSAVSSRQHSFSTITNTANEHKAHPELKAVSVMATWNLLEPAKNSFNWSQMNSNINHAKDNGYKIIFRIMAGAEVPDWLKSDPTVQTINIRGTDPRSSEYCNLRNVPVPWGTKLESHYRDLMTEVGSWLDQSLSNGSKKGDHVYFIPVAMPTFQGSEMVIGYGPNTSCTDDETGQYVSSLYNFNKGRWDAMSTLAERRSNMKSAWEKAIDIHMTHTNVEAAVAYGHIFLDNQSAAIEIARTKVAQYPDRLWTMETNLRPKSEGNTIVGNYADWCGNCDKVFQAATESYTAAGVIPRIGFQTAGVSILNTSAKYTTALEEGLNKYKMLFLETQPDQVDNYSSFLLTGQNSIQDRMQALVD